VVLVGHSSGIVLGQVSVQDQIQEAVVALAEASSRGGDVSGLVAELNVVILEVDSGEYDAVEASNTIDGIIVEAEYLAMSAASENTLGLALTGINLVVVVALGILVWRYFPTIYWRIWLRYRGHWIVE
jgi:hypothetical protein